MLADGIDESSGHLRSKNRGVVMPMQTAGRGSRPSLRPDMPGLAHNMQP